MDWCVDPFDGTTNYAHPTLLRPRWAYTWRGLHCWCHRMRGLRQYSAFLLGGPRSGCLGATTSGPSGERLQAIWRVAVVTGFARPQRPATQLREFCWFTTAPVASGALAAQRRGSWPRGAGGSIGMGTGLSSWGHLPPGVGCSFEQRAVVSVRTDSPLPASEGADRFGSRASPTLMADWPNAALAWRLLRLLGPEAEPWTRWPEASLSLDRPRPPSAACRSHGSATRRGAGSHPGQVDRNAPLRPTGTIFGLGLSGSGPAAN